MSNRLHRRARPAITLMLALWLSALMTAQSSRLEGGISSHAGFDFYWETRLEPAMPALAPGFDMALLESAPNIVHRVMLDRAQKVYFGYDARVEVLSGNTYRVTIGALSMTSELRRLLGDDASTWRMLPAPRFPGPQTIRGGEVLELPLLVNSGWSQRLTDYVTIREPSQRTFESGRREFVFTPGAARDFTVDDAELRLIAPLVTATTRQGPTGSIQRRKVPGEFAGPVLWVYVPYRGRFLLSLRPLPGFGFQKAGEVRGTSMRFRFDDTNYVVSSEERIASGQATFNLYVLRQPDWKPTYPNANLDAFQFGSADRAAYLAEQGKPVGGGNR